MRLIATGNIAYDYLMKFPGKFSEQIIPDQLEKLSITFVADEMSKRRGGNAANIAYTFALLGGSPLVLAAVGDDFDEYERALKLVKVDTSAITRIPNVLTAAFFSTVDLAENQLNTFYSGASFYSASLSLRSVNYHDVELVIISPTDLKAMKTLAAESRDLGLRFVYDPGHQLARLSGNQLLEDIQGAYGITLNEYEAALFFKKTNLTLEKLVNSVDLVVVTRGVQGSHIYSNGSLIEIPPVPSDEAVDPIGAGDSYRAGLFFGLLSGLSPALAGRIGALCGTFAVEKIGTQSHYFTQSDFLDRFRVSFGDEHTRTVSAVFI